MITITSALAAMLGRRIPYLLSSVSTFVGNIPSLNTPIRRDPLRSSSERRWLQSHQSGMNHLSIGKDLSPYLSYI